MRARYQIAAGSGKIKRTLNLDFTSIFQDLTYTFLQKSWTLASSHTHFCKHFILSRDKLADGKYRLFAFQKL